MTEDEEEINFFSTTQLSWSELEFANDVLTPGRMTPAINRQKRMAKQRNRKTNANNAQRQNASRLDEPIRPVQSTKASKPKNRRAKRTCNQTKTNPKYHLPKSSNGATASKPFKSIPRSLSSKASNSSKPKLVTAPRATAHNKDFDSQLPSSPPSPDLGDGSHFDRDILDYTKVLNLTPSRLRRIPGEVFKPEKQEELATSAIATTNCLEPPSICINPDSYETGQSETIVQHNKPQEQPLRKGTSEKPRRPRARPKKGRATSHSGFKFNRANVSVTYSSRKARSSTTRPSFKNAAESVPKYNDSNSYDDDDDNNQEQVVPHQEDENTLTDQSAEKHQDQHSAHASRQTHKTVNEIALQEIHSSISLATNSDTCPMCSREGQIFLFSGINCCDECCSFLQHTAKENLTYECETGLGRCKIDRNSDAECCKGCLLGKAFLLGLRANARISIQLRKDEVPVDTQKSRLQNRLRQALSHHLPGPKTRNVTPSKKFNDTSSRLKCIICSHTKRTSSFLDHDVCYSCLLFLERSAEKDFPQKCPKGGGCDINMKPVVKSCQTCKLQKALRAGMNHPGYSEAKIKPFNDDNKSEEKTGKRQESEANSHNQATHSNQCAICDLDFKLREYHSIFICQACHNFLDFFVNYYTKFTCPKGFNGCDPSEKKSEPCEGCRLDKFLELANGESDPRKEEGENQKDETSPMSFKPKLTTNVTSLNMNDVKASTPLSVETTQTLTEVGDLHEPSHEGECPVCCRYGSLIGYHGIVCCRICYTFFTKAAHSNFVKKCFNGDYQCVVDWRKPSYRNLHICSGCRIKKAFNLGLDHPAGSSVAISSSIHPNGSGQNSDTIHETDNNNTPIILDQDESANENGHSAENAETEDARQVDPPINFIESAAPGETLDNVSRKVDEGSSEDLEEDDAATVITDDVTHEVNLNSRSSSSLQGIVIWNGKQDELQLTKEFVSVLGMHSDIESNSDIGDTTDHFQTAANMSQRRRKYSKIVNEPVESSGSDNPAKLEDDYINVIDIDSTDNSRNIESNASSVCDISPPVGFRDSDVFIDVVGNSSTEVNNDDSHSSDFEFGWQAKDMGILALSRGRCHKSREDEIWPVIPGDLYDFEFQLLTQYLDDADDTSGNERIGS